MIKVWLADRHAVTRDGLRQILESTGEFTIAGEACNGPSALELARRCAADAAIVDLATLGERSTEFVRQIHAAAPALRVLVLSSLATRHDAARLFKAGAAGYVTMESSSRELMDALRKIVAGGVYVSVDVAERLARHLDLPADAPPHERLSERETEVLRRFASGESISEIAHALHISAKTVSTYKARALDKLELPNEAALIRYAIAHRIADPE
ncbi:Two component transcriptional regulator, LuxR family [Burkholderia multivorans]